MSKQVVPYSDSVLGKKEQVALMFNRIASRYDLMNSLLSVGIYKTWRKKVVKELVNVSPQQILDVATGTGDIAIQLVKLKPQQITGIDISNEMLEIGKRKVKESGLAGLIHLEYADSESLPFADNNFDAVTVAYGVRNFENLEKGLEEIYRVLKPQGKLVVLEFSKPRNPLIKRFFDFYFHQICPLIGKWVAGEKSAYTYLPQSVKQFPEGQQFCSILEKTGFTNTQCKPLTFGIASIYTGIK